MKDTLKWRLEYKPDKIQWVRIIMSFVLFLYVKCLEVNPEEYDNCLKPLVFCMVCTTITI